MQSDDLRYSRLGDIIGIVIRMRGKKDGLSLEEMSEQLGATRRTAERVRDAILSNFMQVDELPSKGRCKRWGFTDWYGQRAFTCGLISFTENELLELEHLKEQARQKKDARRDELLGALLDKIGALRKESKDSALIEDSRLKLLTEAEGYAVSQFSYRAIEPNILSGARNALVSSYTLVFTYTKKKGGESSQREVEPYGMLYHHKNYLVAKDGELIKLFDLSRISDMGLGSPFSPDTNFNLGEFAQKSFGVFQEEPMDVRLLFSPWAAEDVLDYHFHPTQTIQLKESGEVEVRFRAGGSLAIIWELFKWNTGVQILEPQSLKEAYINELQETLKNLQK